jgi:hypothetical protein
MSMLMRTGFDDARSPLSRSGVARNVLLVAVWGDECGIATLPIERVPGDLEEHREVVEPERLEWSSFSTWSDASNSSGLQNLASIASGPASTGPVVFDRSTA